MLGGREQVKGTVVAMRGRASQWNSCYVPGPCALVVSALRLLRPRKPQHPNREELDGYEREWLPELGSGLLPPGPGGGAACSPGLGPRFDARRRRRGRHCCPSDCCGHMRLVCRDTWLPVPGVRCGHSGWIHTERAKDTRRSSRGGSGGGPNKQPVLLQHGVLVDGMTWLLNPPEQDLPLILADNGFDVWISNTRGTQFSRRHTSLDPANPDFWNWSWDELVAFDLPAVFDFIHGKTGKKIDYVGHSLGTLTVLASLSEGRLVDKLQSAALLSPIAYLSHMTTALGVAAAKAFVGEITTLFGLAEFNPKGEPVANFLQALCAYPGVDCYDLLAALTGKNCCLNVSTVDLFLDNEPQSTSTRNLVHLSQTVRDGVLAKYDYGNPIFNVMHYGGVWPPVYNLSNIPRDLPIFLSYGGRDALRRTGCRAPARQPQAPRRRQAHRPVHRRLRSRRFHNGSERQRHGVWPSAVFLQKPAEKLLATVAKYLRIGIEGK
ncbi:hypothetical protein NL676_006274 [Syzygium grande]|nr:hypothetical protein NL676_006274 [Syzygium grande]